MTILNDIQTNFASGEIDPTLRGQIDLKAYRNGARRIRNMQRRATGGLERRYGSYDLVDMGADRRLAEFEFSAEQRYVMAFGPGSVVIYDLNGVLLTALINCPWTIEQAFELTYTQLGDTMVVTHTAFATQLIKRTAATTFVIVPFAFDISIDGNRVYQPYFKFADATTSILPSAGTGSISLKTNAPFFTANYVGLRIRIYDCEVLITAYTSPTEVTAMVQGELTGKLDLDPFKTTAGSTTVEVLHLFHGLTNGAQINLSGSNSVGGIAGSAIDGPHLVTVIDELRYAITATAAATSSEDGGGPNVEFGAGGTATRAWLEPSISKVRGYPGASSFHEGRLWLAGTTAQPDGVWGSKATFPFNFDVGKGYDGDSVQGAAGSEDVSTILHIVSNGDLQLYTATRESIFITREGEAITPNNQRVKGQGGAGSGKVQPVIFDSATLYVQENGLSVSELTYSSEKGGYVPVPISTLAGHLVRRPISTAASVGTTSRAEQFAFFVNGGSNPKEDVPEGSVAVFHSLRSENIAGWALWTMGAGKVRSVAAIGPYVFFSVAVRGSFRLYRMADTDLISLDGAVHHVSVAAKKAWTLDARVRGRTVAIVSELGYHGMLAVPADGAIAISVPVKNLVAGDPFFFQLETLPPVVQLPNGGRILMVKRIVRSIIDFDDAYAVTVNGRRLETRNAGDDFAGAVRPIQGAQEVGSLGFSRAPTIVISQLEPLPARILSINQKVKT